MIKPVMIVFNYAKKECGKIQLQPGVLLRALRYFSPEIVKYGYNAKRYRI